MNKNDLFIAILILILIGSFIPFKFLNDYHTDFLYNNSYWYITSFLKFAVLATLGESIGLRISKGVYNTKGFGLIPRAIVWGFIGIGIKIAFVVFASGTPVVLEKLFSVKNSIKSMEYNDVFDAFSHNLGYSRILTAFSISLLLNILFAPVFMTFHKITDTHIINNGGTISGFFKPINFKEIFPALNWKVQWNFIFKKTIPLFWIPAHTITFLMPSAYRIIFAAFLGIILGVFLAIGNSKK